MYREVTKNKVQKPKTQDQSPDTMTKLSPKMTLKQFENGYFYAVELKEFAQRIGIPSANKLRKDELERAIKHFLKTGKLPQPTGRNLANSGRKDVERGLRFDLPVVVYTNDKATKDFLEKESQKLAPGVKRKSGARYRLNRWREDQISNGVNITYGDLVKEYVRLNQTAGPFAHVPQVRYINFVADFLAAEKGATRAQAIKAWRKLKTLDRPKDYRSWATWSRSTKRN
jgi:hypothetical protein